MAVDDTAGDDVADGLLARARDAARESETPGWSVIADSVMRRARAVAVPDQTVLARVGDDGSRTWVSTRVLLAAVRRSLTRSSTHMPTDVSFRVAEDHLRGVSVSLVAAFGVDLLALGDEVRSRLAAELGDLVPGAAAGGGPPEVDVTITDVVDGDPRRV